MRDMRPRIKSNFVSFTDGTGRIYGVKNRVITSVKQEVVHFDVATVGERRFWDAYVAGIQINEALKVPLGTNVQRGDVLEHDGAQYEVRQIDLKQEGLTQYILLSLSAIPIAFNINLEDA